MFVRIAALMPTTCACGSTEECVLIATHDTLGLAVPGDYRGQFTESLAVEVRVAAGKTLRLLERPVLHHIAAPR